MLPRERVIAVIQHKKPDRIPIYGWLCANLEKQLSSAYGSVENFEDKYEFDYAHLFGGPPCYLESTLATLRTQSGGEITPEMLLDVPMCDPDNSDAYKSLVVQISHHKEQRGRFVYVQTPGIFEAINGVFGIENHFVYLLLHQDALRKVYDRQATWNKRFANNCIDLGIDMIHISDDWGSQNSLLFNPDTWWNLIYPYHKVICDTVKSRNTYLSLHSDGNISQIIDGIIKLGYDVVHPWQESAGMNMSLFKSQYRDKLTIMGGLDVQSTLGFGNMMLVQDEIERILRLFADGGLLFCTSHFVQDHCGIKELAFAYDTAYRLCREVCQG
jgi:uroporphyrinogen decarboxylase